MQKYRNRILLGFGLVFAIYVFLLILADSSGQFDAAVWDRLQRFPIWLVPLLILTQLAANFFRFLEWHYFLGVIDARNKISLKDSLIIFVSGFTMAVSPGKVAEVLKAVLLKLRTGVPVAVSAPVVIAERVIDGLAVIVTLVITLIFALDHIELGQYQGISEGVIFTSASLLLFGLIAVQIAPLAYLCLNLIARIPLLNRFQQPLTEFYESSREIFKLKHVIPTVLMGLGVYASSTAGFMLVLWGLGLELTWTLLIQTTFIVGVVSAIGALSFVPNGAGVTEISSLAMLNVLIAPHNPELTPAVAAAAALIQSFFHKWFRVVVGMAVAVVYRQRLFTAELEAELQTMQQTSPQLTTEQA